MSTGEGKKETDDLRPAAIPVPSIQADSAPEPTGASESEPPSAPVVFQCIQCGLCIGDSIAMLRADEETQTITLSGVSNIRWSGSVFTSKGGHDVGNTYFAVNCANCEVRMTYVEIYLV
jgi:L-lactate utilization protein LutB